MLDLQERESLQTKLGEVTGLLDPSPKLKTLVTLWALFLAMRLLDTTFLEKAKAAGMNQSHRAKRMVIGLSTLPILELDAQFLLSDETVRDVVGVFLLPILGDISSVVLTPWR